MNATIVKVQLVNYVWNMFVIQIHKNNIIYALIVSIITDQKITNV